MPEGVRLLLLMFRDQQFAGGNQRDGAADDQMGDIPDGGVAGKNEFSEDWRPEYKSHYGASPEKRIYIETRILTEVAGTIAHDLRFPERGHDAGDAFDKRWAYALIEESACWADDDRDSYSSSLKRPRAVYCK
jgi:hypothetical protein